MTPSLWLSIFFQLLDTWEIYFWSCYELWERWWWWPSQPSEDPQWKMQCQVIKQTWEKLNPPRIRSYSSGCNCAEREKIEVLILNYLYELCMFVSVCHYVCVCLPVYAWVGDHQAKTISLGREKRIQSHGWERKSRWCDLPHTHCLQFFHQWRLYSFYFISWGREFLWKHIGLKDWTFVA